MFCSHCGFDVGEGKFCPKCGALQKQEIEVSNNNDSIKNSTKSKINKKVVLSGFGVGIVILSFLTFLLMNPFSKDKTKETTNGNNISLATVSKKDLKSMKIIDINTDDFPSIKVKVKVAASSEIKNINENSINILEKGIKQKVKSFSEDNDGKNVFLIIYNTNDETFDNTNRLVDISLTNGNISYSTNSRYQLSQPIASKISINQVDSSNFPEISVYFTAEDNKGQILKGLKKNYIIIKENNSTALVEEEILELRQMNLKEPLNINLVMDTSGSMEGYKINTAKDAALKFLNSVQFNSGDLVELITFNDIVSMGQMFTNQKNSIDTAIMNLNTNSQTALYDALNAALVETSRKSGPKCIIAFTDGLDNKSKVSSDYVTDLAKKLGIPIYIIGIGSDVDSNILQDVSQKTGGYFTQISDIEKLQQIYKDIFKQQKEQYILKYKTKNNTRDGLFRSIDFKLISGKYLGNTSGSYVPKYAIDPNVNPSTGYSSQYGMTDIEKALYDYQYNFVKAVNSYDFSMVSQYIDSNGPLYNMQNNLIASYKKQGIQEKLIFYSIESTKKINDNEYQLVVYEKFYITYGAKMPALMEYRNVYSVKSTGNGWKLSDILDLKVLNNVPVNYNAF